MLTREYNKNTQMYSISFISTCLYLKCEKHTKTFCHSTTFCTKLKHQAKLSPDINGNWH